MATTISVNHLTASIYTISNLSPTNGNICLNLCPVWRGQNFSVLRKRKRLDGGDGGSES